VKHAASRHDEAAFTVGNEPADPATSGQHLTHVIIRHAEHPAGDHVAEHDACCGDARAFEKPVRAREHGIEGRRFGQ
jgi:hypothetical protein